MSIDFSMRMLSFANWSSLTSYRLYFFEMVVNPDKQHRYMLSNKLEVRAEEKYWSLDLFFLSQICGQNRMRGPLT